jgi:hypothetical protein
MKIKKIVVTNTLVSQNQRLKVRSTTFLRRDIMCLMVTPMMHIRALEAESQACHLIKLFQSSVRLSTVRLELPRVAVTSESRN